MDVDINAHFINIIYFMNAYQKDHLNDKYKQKCAAHKTPVSPSIKFEPKYVKGLNDK